MSDIKIVIRAFRAINNLEACEKYVEGHVRVLKIYGITMITSANVEWFTDPYTYVILVESEDGEKIYGGARIQVAGGMFELPIEKAVKDFDLSVHQLVERLTPGGTGELCGLWNSREVAGFGIGSIYLGRVGVAISTQLNLSTLFALCAPATVKNCIRVGFLVEGSLGNNGTFYYPKEDLIATAVLINDVSVLSTAEPEERDAIMKLRAKPVQYVIDPGPKGRLIEIDYRIQIDNNI